jgi:hypothetical protein
MRVKRKLLLRLLNALLVCLVKVSGEDHIPILAHRLHSSLLANGADFCSTDLVRAVHIVLQIYFITNVHFCRASTENHAFLPAVWVRKLNLSVQAAGTQQGRIQGICSICGHNNLHHNTVRRWKEENK